MCAVIDEPQENCDVCVALKSNAQISLSFRGSVPSSVPNEELGVNSTAVSMRH